MIFSINQHITKTIQVKDDTYPKSTATNNHTLIVKHLAFLSKSIDNLVKMMYYLLNKCGINVRFA
jgi:hypothetical protein